MRNNNRKNTNPPDDPEDIAYWAIPSALDETPAEPSSRFFIPPTSPPASMPATPSGPLFTESASEWVEATPSAEVRDFPVAAKSTTPYRPDLPQPGAVIDLTSRTPHLYDELYALSSDEASEGIEATLQSTATIDLTERLGAMANVGPDQLPVDLRQALRTATSPVGGLPRLDSSPVAGSSLSSSFDGKSANNEGSDHGGSRPSPPGTPHSPSMISIDVLGVAPVELSGLFTDILSDNGFKVSAVSPTSTVLTRSAGTITIDLVADSAGCIIEVEDCPVAAIHRLVLSGLLQIGFELVGTRDRETVLRHSGRQSMIRLVTI